MITLSYYPTHNGPVWSVLIDGQAYTPTLTSSAEARAAFKQACKGHPNKGRQAWNSFVQSVHVLS